MGCRRGLLLVDGFLVIDPPLTRETGELTFCRPSFIHEMGWGYRRVRTQHLPLTSHSVHRQRVSLSTGGLTRLECPIFIFSSYFM